MTLTSTTRYVLAQETASSSDVAVRSVFASAHVAPLAACAFFFAVAAKTVIDVLPASFASIIMIAICGFIMMAAIRGLHITGKRR